MTVTERFQAAGSFDLTLRANTPLSIRQQIAPMGTLFVLPAPIPSGNLATTANLLAAARYTGVVIDAPEGGYKLTGMGQRYLLGGPNFGHSGDALTAKVNLAGVTLSSAFATLFPAAQPLHVGTVTDAGTSTITTDLPQLLSRGECLETICSLAGAEWRIRPDGTIDAGTTANVFVTTPTVVLLDHPGSAATGNIVGVDTQTMLDTSGSGYVTGALVRGGSMSQPVVQPRPQLLTGKSGKQYATRVLVAGRGGDAAAVPIGTASGTALYTDVWGNNLALIRVADAPATTSSNVNAAAAALLAQATIRSTVKLSATMQDPGQYMKPGDNLYVYDRPSGLVDTANQINFDGQKIAPAIVRLQTFTWGVTNRFGVWYRSPTGTLINLTDYFEPEQPNVSFEVGQGTTTAGDITPFGTIGPASAAVARSVPLGQRVISVLSANSVNNNAVANSLQNTVPNVLTFPVTKGTYGFRAFVTYNAALASTGSRWTIYCATGTPIYRSEYALSKTSRTVNEGMTTYQQPATCNASSAATTGNTAIIEGIIVATTNDVVYLQFASEIAGSAITALAGLTYFESWQIA